MSLKGMAQKTLDIIDQDLYRLPTGETVDGGSSFKLTFFRCIATVCSPTLTQETLLCLCQVEKPVRSWAYMPTR